MFSRIALLALIGSLTAANPVPDISPRDVYPSGPQLPTVANGFPDCGEACEFMCWKFTRARIAITGVTHNSQYSSRRTTVNYQNMYNNVDICPEKLVECHGTCHGFGTDCNSGWSFTFPDAPMEGPWPYTLSQAITGGIGVGGDISKSTPLLDEFGEVYKPDGEIPMDDIECDTSNCGGDLIPMTCRVCKYAHAVVVYETMKIDGCKLPNGDVLGGGK